MMYLGGQTITGIGWAGSHAVYVDFVSSHVAGFVWQLYAGRKLIGTTNSPRARRVVGQLPPAESQSALTLVRVSLDSRLTDFGADLPSQPFNRYRLRWSGAGLPANTDHFDLVWAGVAGAAPDPDLVIARVPFVGAIEYSYLLPALATSGAWQFGIIPRDDAKPLGNPGTETDVTINAVVLPADVQVAADGSRFSLAVAAGVLTASFAY